MQGTTSEPIVHLIDSVSIESIAAATVAKPRPSNSIMISVRSAAWPDHKASHLADRLVGSHRSSRPANHRKNDFGLRTEGCGHYRRLTGHRRQFGQRLPRDRLWHCCQLVPAVDATSGHH